MNQTTTALKGSPLYALPAAERQLCSAIHAAAAALDTIARDPVEEALSRLHAAAEGAKSRLAATRAELAVTVTGVLAEFASFAGEVLDGVFWAQADAELPPLGVPAAAHTSPHMPTCPHQPAPSGQNSTTSHTEPALRDPVPEPATEPIAAPVAIPAFETADAVSHNTEPVVTTAACPPVEPAAEPSGEEPTGKTARKSRRTRKA